MNIRPMGTELLFHADRRTNMTNLKAAFRNFANAPKKKKTIIIPIKISFILNIQNKVKLFNSKGAIAYEDKRWEFSVDITFRGPSTLAYM